ncbi:MAG: chorismate mutase [Rhodospirillales bacterium]|nr:MAG: chorismate mutase [Rhodospirillales bacterium]
MKTEAALDALRREIDLIDDTIHDLIMRRTQFVEQVREIKRDLRVKIRPSREAEIVYRLIDRHHGPFPKRELVAMWRQLIVATLAFEGPFSVAVYVPPDGAGHWDLARDHFGIFTPATRYTSVRTVIEAVHRQDATVGVLPLPQHDDRDPWWRHLVTEQPEVPRIIARLPFAGHGTGLGTKVEGLAICPVGLTPTGRDRSIFAIDMDRRISINRLTQALAEIGLPTTFVTSWHEEQGPSAWLHLVEVDGFIADGDERLGRIAQSLGEGVNRVVALGGYATPLTPEELGTERITDSRTAAGAAPAEDPEHR